MTVVSIMQPAYWPWCGYFDRIAKSDVHIELDDVDIDSNSKTKFANRNKIRTRDGWQWITIPLQHDADRRIHTLRTATPPPWRKQHENAIHHAYARAPFFQEHAPAINGLYARDLPLLTDATRATTEYLRGVLDIKTPTLRSSEMGVTTKKDQLILDLCMKAGATEYLSGPFGRDYLDEEAFRRAGIRVRYHDFAQPTYAQCHAGFVPNLSALDLVLNHGPAARAILLDRAQTAPPVSP